jgi:hypothetical protein
MNWDIKKDFEGYKNRRKSNKRVLTKEELDETSIISTDLNNYLIKEASKEVDSYNEAKIEELKEQKERFKNLNRKAASFKRAVMNRLKNPNIKSKKYPFINELDERKLISIYRRPPAEYITYDLKAMFDNQINYLKRKNFEFIIDDGFNDVYKINKKELLKKNNPAEFIFKKMLEGTEEAIKKAKSEGKKREKQLKGLNKFKNVLIYNIDIVSGNKSNEEEKYPIFIEVFGPNIKI